MRRHLVGIAAAALLAVPGVARAQGYFGQNKVQYATFDWHIIETQHFEVHYYGVERQAAVDAARMAERSYARLSRILQHEWREKKPLILYASQSDFAQTNTTGEDLGEGTGGFTDFYRHRMVMPFTGSYADLQHVLTHEMVHAFQFDIFARGHAGNGLSTISQINPPLWFLEGMAEYLSIGPVDPQTSMWMRDAAIHGNMPTIEQLTYDGRFFPYRYGHALWAYIGQKWGDESIGAILQGTMAGGIERAFQRVLGITLDQLGDEWVEAVQNTYLPQVPNQERPRTMARMVLNQRNSGGRYHVSPQISPDGRSVVYLSERNFFFIDMYLADVETGKHVTKLVSSAFNANFESLRFVNSAGSWAPNGREFMFVSKNRDQDVLNIMDVRHRRVERTLRLGFSGIGNPSFSPDGLKIVFTGFKGGWSDLYIVDADGQNLRRLTNDANADLMPQWSPDGRTIAFSTDRGPATDFSALRFSNLRIALYWLDGDSIQVLPRMDEGKNTNPVWAPDGQSLAFLSNRTGIDNVFLYDFAAQNVYQLTRAYTGISGITDLSPAISWARDADRMVITYYEDGAYNVYSVDNPRALKREPFRSDPMIALQYANASAQPLRADYALGSNLRQLSVSDATPLQAISPQAAMPAAGVLPGPTNPPGASAPAPGAAPAGGQPAASPSSPSGSIYRNGGSLRPSGDRAELPAGSAARPLSVAALLDSVQLALPDTLEFTFKDYKPQYSADFVSRPTIGYERDNFGRGFFGGAAVQLSDLLGDHQILLAGAVNGRISEAQFYAAYTNIAHRWNWQVSASQQVLYYYGGTDSVGNPVLDRWTIRQVGAEFVRPFNRFQRLELSAGILNLAQSTLTELPCIDPTTGLEYVCADQINDGISQVALMPSIALVDDNSLFGYTSPFIGHRYRVQMSQAIPLGGNGLQYTQGLLDLRSYKMLGIPFFTLATRVTGMGRFGRDEGIFPMFMGQPDLVRGYTYGSFLNNECLNAQSNGQPTDGCRVLNQLVGSRMVVGSAELRFPLLRSGAFGFIPVGLPPVEGAFWYDAGLAWNGGDKVQWTRSITDPDNVRSPISSYGFAVRMNLFGFAILNLDYAVPRNRPGLGGYWILSLNPPF
ncbi:MAG: BamA/TamA family outer membrane protein [Gemmatimonadales bacterium]